MGPAAQERYVLSGAVRRRARLLDDVGCDFTRVSQVPELSAQFLKFNMKRLRKLWIEAPTATPIRQYEDQ
eukprot:1610469-Pyramimonas_sp.AAC.1